MPRPETLNALLGDIAKSQTRDIQTCRHCGDVTTLARVTDRCDRCDRRVDESSSVIYHLPTSSQREPDPPRNGWVFSFPESAKGRAPSLCSLCSLRIDGGRLTSEPGALEVEQRGQRGGIAEHERARNERESSARAAGSRPTGLLEIFAKLKEEKYLKIQRQIRLPRPSAATPKTASLCALRCIFGCIFPCILNLPPPPPEIRGKTTASTRHHPRASSLRSGVVSGFYGGFGI